ncbi:MAG: nickel-responsive transcriptional regulator NikR [Gammaproteobacteria bacterium]
MNSTETIRFTISLPKPLLSTLDERIIRTGYASRSEFVRDLIRDQLVRDQWTDPEADVFGVLTLSYDHHQSGLVDKLIGVQHDRYAQVLCTTHVHIDHQHCLEAIIIRGKPAQLDRLANELGGARGVRVAKLTRASPVDL